MINYIWKYKHHRLNLSEKDTKDFKKWLNKYNINYYKLFLKNIYVIDNYGRNDKLITDKMKGGNYGKK